MKRKTNVLIIDDERSTLNLLQGILEKEGYTVVTAVDGEEGLCKLLKHNIQIVVCDILMPKVDGIDFLKRIRHCLNVQVIMITGKSDLSRCIKSLQLGACGYLIKPIVAKDLLTLVRSAKRRAAERESLFKKLYKDLGEGHTFP